MSKVARIIVTIATSALMFVLYGVSAQAAPPVPAPHPDLSQIGNLGAVLGIILDSAEGIGIVLCLLGIIIGGLVMGGGRASNNPDLGSRGLKAVLFAAAGAAVIVAAYAILNVAMGIGSRFVV